MDIEEIRIYCLSFEHTEEGFPFDLKTLVFKVYGKIFALLPLDTPVRINVKCDPEKAIELREEYSYVSPGFHMSKKHWNTIMFGEASQKQIKEWITDSYQLVLQSVPKSKRK